MKSIRITSIPNGQAPEWVKNEWIGITIPILPPVRGVALGVVTGAIVSSQSSYQVSTVQALDLLRKKNRYAAEWFEQNAVLADRFCFAATCCELVE
ncbi:MAG: hypothetical protein WCJ59_02565 [bacterium]